MEKKRRAERLIAYLRLLVMMPGLAAASEAQPVNLAAMLGIVALYNGAMLYCVADGGRFMRHGRKVALISRALDVLAISYVTISAGPRDSSAYLLYWFVLVGFGYASAQLRGLLIAGAGVMAANALSAILALWPWSTPQEVFMQTGVRSGLVVFGFLISAYIAKTRWSDDLASERGSYLHAIVNCGARLVSFRSVHELAHYVLETAVTEINAVGGELLLVNGETGELECEAFFAAGGPSGGAGAPSEGLRRSYANWVMNSGREFLVRTGGRAGEDVDLERDDRPALATPLLGQQSSSEKDTSVLGVMMLWGYPGEDFANDAMDILRIFAAIAGAAIVNLRLYTNLQKSFLRTLQSLANGLEARDEYTRGHSERVMRVACMIAEELAVPPELVDSLRNASLLHDIGKIGVPDAVLRKAGKLTAEEWETMRRHSIVSREICAPLGLAPEILFLITHHHERLDGKGYPDGLTAEEQPLLQRVLVVSDSFDAMRSRRPYRDIMPEEELMAEINKCAGRTLDPTVVEALKRLIERGEMNPVYEEHDRLTGNHQAATRHRKAA